MATSHHTLFKSCYHQCPADAMWGLVRCVTLTTVCHNKGFACSQEEKPSSQKKSHLLRAVGIMSKCCWLGPTPLSCVLWNTRGTADTGAYRTKPESLPLEDSQFHLWAYKDTECCCPTEKGRLPGEEAGSGTGVGEVEQQPLRLSLEGSVENTVIPQPQTPDISIFLGDHETPLPDLVTLKATLQGQGLLRSTVPGSNHLEHMST